MQTVSPAFTAACQAATNQPQVRVEVAWDGLNFSDETSRVLTGSVTQRLNAPGEALVKPGDVGRAEVKLANADGRFSWHKTTAPLYAHIGGGGGLAGKPARIKLGFGGEYVTVFTGVTADWGPEDDAAGTVDLALADLGYKFLQQKASTGIYANFRADQWLQVLANLAGVASTALDTGLHVIPYCWLDDESLLEEMWEVAAADGGRCYFDGLGVLRYETPPHWLGHSVAWTFRLADAFNLTPRFELGGLAKEIVREYAARVPGLSVVIYKLDALKTIAPGATLTQEARFQYPVLSYLPLTTEDDYVIRSGAGESLTAVTVTVQNFNAQRAEVVITNNDAKRTAVVEFLQLRGWPLLGGPTDQVRVAAAADALGQGRVRTVRGNAYCQSEAQARTLASVLAGQATAIQAVWPLNVAPVPQLELGDKVTFNGRQLSAARSGFVIANRLRFGDTGLTQELDVLDAANLYPYSNYYQVGVTALGATGGRVWY